MVRLYFGRAITIGVETPVVKFCSGRQIRLNSKYSMGNREFIASGGQSMENQLRENIRGEGDSG